MVKNHVTSHPSISPVAMAYFSYGGHAAAAAQSRELEYEPISLSFAKYVGTVVGHPPRQLGVGDGTRDGVRVGSGVGPREGSVVGIGVNQSGRRRTVSPSIHTL